MRLLPLPPERLLELPSERLLVLPPDCLLARHRVALLASIQKASTARPLHEPARAGIVPLMLTSPARPGSRLAMLPLKALWLCQPISKEAFWAHWLQGLEERPTRVPRDAQVEVAAREPFATAYGRTLSCSHTGDCGTGRLRRRPHTNQFLDILAREFESTGRRFDPRSFRVSLGFPQDNWSANSRENSTSSHCVCGKIRWVTAKLT